MKPEIILDDIPVPYEKAVYNADIEKATLTLDGKTQRVEHLDNTEIVFDENGDIKKLTFHTYRDPVYCQTNAASQSVGRYQL